ncbi:putative Solute carrier family 37 member 2 (Glycerol-3-phosphate transporter putative) [Paragonimus kellicotti]|nr:putative Solute carrier family 37 member 2 (Glycerol-3-phosphate transporter putative) [Paragonimus kellicotti]
MLVNGPFGLITTAVAADLGTHPSLRSDTRALATVTGIIDGTGSMGAALGPLLCGQLLPYGWKTVYIMLMVSLAFSAVVSCQLD